MTGDTSGTVEQFRLPDAGEGLTEAEILRWLVTAGDTVEVNDVVVEIETAKALVELPCPFAGTVVGLLVAEGDTVAVGTPILAVRTGAEPATAEPAPTDGRDSVTHGPTEESGAHPSTQAAAGAGRQAVLVGYGPAAGATRRRARRVEVPHDSPGRTATGTASAHPRALAKPPVRKLARDLGVELDGVPPTGAGGVVTRDDVMAAADANPPVAPPNPPRDHARPGRRIPVTGVRRATAEAMVASASTAPHVSEWVQVDVTATVELLDRLRGDRALIEHRLTVLPLVARAVCLAAQRHREVNVTWDDDGPVIVVHPSIGLGFAVATDRGLMVPVLRDAERLDLAGLAGGLTDLVATAREGRLQPAQMSGGTLTITNVGVFGVDGGTPILPPGTGLILALGQVRRLPWVVQEEVVPRWVTTLSVSFDHRMIDGELGSRFLADVARLLEDPGYALAWG